MERDGARLRVGNGKLAAICQRTQDVRTLLRRIEHRDDGPGGEIDLRERPFILAVAFAASAVFLVGYIIYHYAHGDTAYTGEGLVRTIYFTVLITHVLLSIVMLPMILATFYLASKARFATHKKLARWTLPIWLYVSVTGVVIYFMLDAAS